MGRGRGREGDGGEPGGGWGGGRRSGGDCGELVWGGSVEWWRRKRAVGGSFS